MNRTAAVLASVVLMVVALLPPVPAAANDHICNGKDPTVEGNKGTPGDDVIIAERYSRVYGYGGDDTICAWVSEEDDVSGAKVYAGAGDDWVELDACGNHNWFRVWGGGGHDLLGTNACTGVNVFLVGGPGDDTLQGQGNPTQGRLIDETVAVFDNVGSVTVNFRTGRVKTARGGTDRLVHIENVLGGDRPDVFRGGPHRQFINGGGGRDQLNGGGAIDELAGGPGNDVIHGGGESDRLFGGTGKDDVYGDRGVDWLWFSREGDDPFPFEDTYNDAFPEAGLENGIKVNLSKRYARFADSRYELWRIENVLSYRRGDDTIIGNGKANILIGYGGGDRLFGKGGNDDLRDREGRNYFNGGSGNDVCRHGGNDSGRNTFRSCERQTR